MSALIGQYEKPLDEKCRLVVPSEFRKGLGGDDLVLMRWFERTLALFPQATWMEMAQLVNETGDYNESTRGMRRLIYSRSRQASLDKQGRFLIPEDMRGYALLERDTVLIGDWDKVVIWSRPRYLEMGMADEQTLDKRYEETLQEIAALRRRAKEGA